SASMFYGVTTNGRLTQFDMTAQTVTLVSNLHVGPNALNTGFVELEADSNGNLYALRSYSGTGGFPPPQFNEIIRITSPAAGNALLPAPISGRPSNVHTSLAFRSDTGVFYTVRNQNGNLGTLDMASGALSPVSGVGHGSPFFTRGLAINPVS